MSGFTDKEVKEDLERRADARDGKGWQEGDSAGTVCAHCGHPMRFSDSEFPLCDACE